MKKFIFLILVLFTANVLFAQNDSLKKENEIKTVFGNKKVTHGVYFGFSIGYSVIDNKDAFTSGARLMWVIGHSFAWGFAGSGFANNFHSDEGTSLNGGYGGLMFESILLPKYPVHLSFPIMLAVGSVAKVNEDVWEPDYSVDDADAFFIAEPGVELEMNLLRFVRMSIGASYRFTTDIYLDNESRDVLKGFNTIVSIKFGKF